VDRGYLYMALVITFWGLSYPLTKTALQAMSPFTLAFLRFSLGGVILLGWARGLSYGVKQAINGVLNVAAFVVLLNLSVMFTSNPALSAVLAYTQPVFVLVLSATFLRQGIHPLQALGVVLAFTGVLISVGSLNFDLGSGLGLLAGLVWAVGTIYFRRNLTGEHKLRLNAFMSLLSALLVSPTLALDRGFRFSPVPIAAALGVAIMAQALGFLLWFSAIGELGVLRASSLSLLVPASAYLFTFLILGVRPTTLEVLGSATAMMGVFLSQWRVKSRGPEGGRKRN
jgi:drug/metabolite transporter (DMT)-like permease